jgi:signal transduction histidine kinase
MRSPKHRWFRSLRHQLLVTYGIVLVLMAVLVAGALAAIFTWQLDSVTHRGLETQARWISQALQFDATGRPVALAPERNAPWMYESAPADLKYRVLDAGGRVLLAAEKDATALAPAGERFDPARTLFEIVADGVRLDVATVPLQHGDQTFYLQAARSERLNDLVRRAIGAPIFKTVVGMGLASLLVFGVAVYATLCRTLRPVADMSTAAARIEPHNLSARLAGHDLPTELAPLVEAFNQALDRLEKGYRVQQEFLAGAAHELKTPLALIRGQIEMDGATDRAALLRDVDLMARQVHQLLHLAEVSEAQNYVYEATDLAAVASEVTAYLGRLADRRQITLAVQCDAAGAVLKADRSALFVLMKNLVENAIRHSTPGGVVMVRIDAAGLQVRDEGPGIADADFPKLFARFWRGAERRDDGAGLGLAICRQIALTHGWQLSARNAVPGAEFRLLFTPA